MTSKRKQCYVEDPDVCGMPVTGLGMCVKHYRRWKRHGDPLVVNKAGAKAGHQHSQETKDKIGLAHRGRIATDEARANIGAASRGRVFSEEARANMGRSKRHETPAYTAMHSRVGRSRGPASRFKCALCAGAAANWCYDWNDINAVRDEQNRWYSLDESHYIALCLACHHRMDKNRVLVIYMTEGEEAQDS